MAIQLIRVSEALGVDTSLLRHAAKDDRIKTFKDSRRRNLIFRDDLAKFFLEHPWYARRLFLSDPPSRLQDLLNIMLDDYNRLTGRYTMLYFGSSEIGKLFGVHRDRASGIIREYEIPYVIDAKSYFVHEYDFVQFLNTHQNYDKILRTRRCDVDAVEDIRGHLIEILDHKDHTTNLPRSQMDS